MATNRVRCAHRLASLITTDTARTSRCASNVTATTTGSSGPTGRPRTGCRLADTHADEVPDVDLTGLGGVTLIAPLARSLIDNQSHFGRAVCRASNSARISSRNSSMNSVASSGLRSAW